jgi:A/G-specific adenine glycosylase
LRISSFSFSIFDSPFFIFYFPFHAMTYPAAPPVGIVCAIRRRLRAWFRRCQRDLPWRRDRDPYHIWVSEIMLQQTQVASVIPYYERFLQAFPTVAALAAASKQEVLRVWEGLGYYRRARDLHRAARQMIKEHGRQMPRHRDAWAALPGIGRYTLGAILSQAFDERLPIVEANSARVLCRWFACDGDPRSAAVQRWLWETATRFLPAKGAGEFNQALMELGALVCTPGQPSCLLCPVSQFCAARARGMQADIPRKIKPPQTTAVREVAVIVQKGRSVLLAQRPASAARWADFWEFPHGEIQPGESAPDAAQRLIRDLIGVQAALRDELVTLRHGITRYSITMICFLARWQSGRFHSPFYARATWRRAHELAAYPLSSPQRKLAEAVHRHLTP